MNYLVGPAIARRHNADGIFNCDSVDVRPVFNQIHEEPYRLDLLSLFIFEPARTGYCQMRAGWKGDHQIPRLFSVATTENFDHVFLQVRPWFLAWQQVAGPRLMPASNERIAHNSTEFTGN